MRSEWLLTIVPVTPPVPTAQINETSRLFSCTNRLNTFVIGFRRTNFARVVIVEKNKLMMAPTHKDLYFYFGCTVRRDEEKMNDTRGNERKGWRRRKDRVRYEWKNWFHMKVDCISLRRRVSTRGEWVKGARIPCIRRQKLCSLQGSWCRHAEEPRVGEGIGNSGSSDVNIPYLQITISSHSLVRVSAVGLTGYNFSPNVNSGFFFFFFPFLFLSSVISTFISNVQATVDG